MYETMQEGIDNSKDLSATDEENLKNRRIMEALFLPRNCLPHRFIENISKLVDLNLSGCKLKFLPTSFTTLYLLSYLNLDNNNITHLSPIICELTNLKKLWLRKNFIQDIPNNFGDLTKLEVLFLSSNKLSKLPASCSNLNNLEILCLRDNWFRKIPECVRDGMKQLKNLLLSGNYALNLDVQPASIRMTSFYVDCGNHSTLFPMWTLQSKYKCLETVSLNKIKLRLPNSCLPTEVSYVKKLSMKQCSIMEDEIEKIISRMIYLEELIIEDTMFKNSFSKLPLETKKDRSSLKQLTMWHTKLRTIPEYIKEFENLSSLDLDSNDIYSLPDEICHLHNLVYLMINNNHLTSLPKNIGDLTSLKELKLRHNHLDKLPDSVRFLKALEYLDLYDNDLEHIPEAVCELTGLIGLDLEQNYFSIDDDYLWSGRTRCYKHMRDALRRSNPDVVYYGFKSLCGPKIQPDETGLLSNQFECYNESVCDDSSIFSSKTETETKTKTETETFYDENENWDSENSADEFDPYEVKEPRKSSYSPFTFYKPFQQVYCPGDFHEISVLTRVVQMLHNGTMVRSLEYEEGQFEDP